MRPDERELDEEIRGHLASSTKERIERGEDPEAARLAARGNLQRRSGRPVAATMTTQRTHRMTELFGQLAVGSSPRHLLLGVVCEGARIVLVGVGVGAAGGYALTGVARTCCRRSGGNRRDSQPGDYRSLLT